MFLQGVVVLISALLVHGGVHLPLKSDEKIVGGTEAAQGEIPWQVSLQYDNGVHFCGGSIISANWVVTAAHCSVGEVPGDLRVVAGTLETSNPGSKHKVSRIIIHEDYDDFDQANDIALWEVSEPFLWDSNTAAVGLLPQNAPSPTGTATVVSGWGTTTMGGSPSDVLLKVTVPIFNLDECRSIYLGSIPPYQICAGLEEGGVDSCKGDSGGPLFFEGNLYGIVSWGNGCANPGYPGVYTEVASYRDWITANSGV